jgi:hypothetical protein
VSSHFCQLKNKPSKDFSIKKWRSHFLIWYNAAFFFADICDEGYDKNNKKCLPLVSGDIGN